MAVVIQSTRTVFPQIIGGHYVVPVGHRYFVERPEGRDDWLMLVSLRGVVPDLVALFPPGVTQGYRAWPGEPWNFLWIHFFPPRIGIAAPSSTSPSPPATPSASLTCVPPRHPPAAASARPSSNASAKPRRTPPSETPWP